MEFPPFNDCWELEYYQFNHNKLKQYLSLILRLFKKFRVGLMIT